MSGVRQNLAGICVYLRFLLWLLQWYKKYNEISYGKWKIILVMSDTETILKWLQTTKYWESIKEQRIVLAQMRSLRGKKSGNGASTLSRPTAQLTTIKCKPMKFIPDNILDR